MEKYTKDMWVSKNFSLQREWDSEIDGIKMSGKWCLRNKYGIIIDFDRYVNDLAERNDLDLYSLMENA